MNGIINVIKPPNMTSQDVVSYLRGLLGERRIGHGGTLDPGAAGVLPVFVGKATRLCDYSINGTKEYLGEISFGKSTDTQDSYGNVTAEAPCSITLNMVQAAFQAMEGEIMQRAPMYSAIKVGGQKLYQIARKGKEVEAPLRTVTIYESRVLEQTGFNRFLFTVRCSKGTYIRTLCCDAAASLGAEGHLSFLLRTRVGIFGLNEGYTLNEIRTHKEQGTLNTILLPADGAVQHLPALILKQKAWRWLKNGAPANASYIKGTIPNENELCRVYLNEQFVGLGSVTADGVRITKLIMEEPQHESLG